MTGVISSFGSRLSELLAEREEGPGFADIRFRDESDKSALVIKLKLTDDPDHMDAEANKAIEQIEKKEQAAGYVKYSRK